jgi:peptidoglycan/LPS O-acetylase OafA/YrhL
MRSWLTRQWTWLLAALLGCEAAVALSVFASVTIGPFLGVVMMLALIVWDGSDKRPSRTLDFIGRASYHLFIAHMSIAAILVVAFHATPNTVSVFVMSVALAFALSGALVPLEWQLNRLRGRVSHWSRHRDQTMTSEAASDPAVSQGALPERHPI